jgi:hypothetical protein
MKNAVITIAVAFLFSSTLVAQDTEGSRASLKGLTGVGVLVENLDNPDAEKDGLSKDQIQTDVELRLRMAGIKVLTEKQMFVTPGMPSLDVNLNTHKRQETYSVALSISLSQMVNLSRDPQISVNATTWRDAEVGTVGSAHLNQVRDKIKDYVDKFINAWLSVNPKH